MVNFPPPAAAVVDPLNNLAREIAESRNLIHGADGDGHPWSPSIIDSAHRRLSYLRTSRNELVIGEVRRGHDPVDVAVRAHLDPADVARILAVALRAPVADLSDD